MSIFDKFNATPYQRTYAGAPINEAMQVVKGLNVRAQQNIDAMDKTQLMLNDMPAVTDADKAFKQQYAASLNKKLEGIMDAPEHATAKVRSVAKEFAMDPTLKKVQATAKAAADWQTKFDEDPAKYGDVSAWQFQQALQSYNEAGGAEGGASFKAPALYEQIDVNKWMRDNGKEIAANEKGIAYVKGEFIHEETGERVSADRAQAILEGAVYADRNIMRQFAAENQMNSAMTGKETTMEDFVSGQVTPYAHMFAYDKTTHTMKGVPKGKGSGGASYEYDPTVATFSGGDIKVKLVQDFEDAESYLNTMTGLAGADSLEDQDRYFKMKTAWGRATDAVVKSEGLDAFVGDYIKTVDPNLFEASETSFSGSGSIKAGTRVQNNNPDNTLENITRDMRSKYPNLNDEQIEKYARQVDNAVRGSMFMTDINNTMSEANTAVLDTEMVDVIDLVGADSRKEKAINRSFVGMLSSLDATTVFGDDGAEEMSGKDLREDYQVGTAKVLSTDVNGTGVTKVSIKDNNGNDQVLTLKLNQDDNSIYRDVAGVYTSAANNPNFSSREQLDFARKGMNVMYDNISASAEMSMQNSGPQPIDFGTLSSTIANHYGSVTLEYDADGDFIARKNGVNLFANSQEFSTFMEQASTPQQAAALVTQYLRQNL